MKIIDEKLLAAQQDETLELISDLVIHGRKQGHVTIDDILLFFPEADQDPVQLEEIFIALSHARIPYVDEASLGEPDDEAGEEELNADEGQSEQESEEDFLANIDASDTLSLYIKEASRVPLLTAEEELDLAKRIERGRFAMDELARGKNSRERSYQLRQLIEDGWAARAHLITANARLVISVAKKYMGRGVPFLDLIQEGNIGLMRAAKKFDYHRGYKFSTYATWWIRQAVTRAVADQGRTIRVPVHMGDQISKLLRAQHQLRQNLSRDPTVEELAEALNVPPKKVEYMIRTAQRPLSLQMPVGDEEDEVLGDFVEDTRAPAPDETAAQNLIRANLDEVMEKLPAREMRVLRLRYGLQDGRTYTLREVGLKLGITRERVRQIEAQALRRLRSADIRQQFHTPVD